MALTAEQIALMEEHFLLDNPQAGKSDEVYADPEYAEAERTLELDDRGAKARAEPELAPIEIELAGV